MENEQTERSEKTDTEGGENLKERHVEEEHRKVNDISLAECTTSEKVDSDKLQSQKIVSGEMENEQKDQSEETDIKGGENLKEKVIQVEEEHTKANNAPLAECTTSEKVDSDKLQSQKIVSGAIQNEQKGQSEETGIKGGENLKQKVVQVEEQLKKENGTPLAECTISEKVNPDKLQSQKTVSDEISGTSETKEEEADSHPPIRRVVRRGRSLIPRKEETKVAPSNFVDVPDYGYVGIDGSYQTPF